MSGRGAFMHMRRWARCAHGWAVFAHGWVGCTHAHAQMGGVCSQVGGPPMNVCGQAIRVCVRGMCGGSVGGQEICLCGPVLPRPQTYTWPWTGGWGTPDLRDPAGIRGPSTEQGQAVKD